MTPLEVTGITEVKVEVLVENDTDEVVVETTMIDGLEVESVLLVVGIVVVGTVVVVGIVVIEVGTVVAVESLVSFKMI